MKIKIRKALQEDAKDYALCHIYCWQTAYKGIVPDDFLENMLVEKEKYIERYKNNLTEPGDCKYYCVIYEEKMIGFITIYKGFNENNFEVGEIWAIYLIEEYRNKNYGKEMLKFAITELKRFDLKEISLWVFEKNIRARKFYESNNFKFDNIKREVERYGKPLTQLRYVLNE